LPAASPADDSRATNDMLMRAALASSVADEPAGRWSAPTTSPAGPGKRPDARPMSAWRAAYIARHHHEPPVKAN
jgi:hypothetical protein